MMAKPKRQGFAFENPTGGSPAYVLRTQPLELFARPVRVSLQPQTPRILIIFLEESDGAPLTREEIADQLWKDADIDPRTVDQHVRLLRRAIGDWCIETVTKVGYRFGTVCREITDEDLRRIQIAPVQAPPRPEPGDRSI